MLATVFQKERWEPRSKHASFLPGLFALCSPSQEKLLEVVLFSIQLHVPSKWPRNLTFGQRSCDSEHLKGKSREAAQPIENQKSKKHLRLAG